MSSSSSSSSIPSESKALVLTTLTPPKLTLTTLPTPQPYLPFSQHLIRVHATALCARELLWPSLFPSTNSAKQLVPGYDLAGVVVTAPPASPFQAGTKVYCRTNYDRTGNAREYTIAPTSELAQMPRNMSFVDAATVALSAETAWQELFVQGGLKAEKDGAKGKRVLVSAASGGVGIWVVQLAKWAGATVVGVCGTDNVEFVKGLGADEVVDYRKTALDEWVKNGGEKVDLVLDGVGGKSLVQAWSTVKDGGVLLSVVEPPEDKKPEGVEAKDVRSWFFIMDTVGEQLEKITKLIEEGVCKPVLDSVYPLEEYEEAFKRCDGGHARGKVVLKIRD